MADITALFGILIAIGIAFPGMLSAWWLLFPNTVERAQVRLERTPWQCFWMGSITTILGLIPIFILLALPFGPAKFAGASLIVILLGISSLGSAGLAAQMGKYLAQKSNLEPAAAFIRSSVALELAVFFPVIGWFLVFPLILVTAIGATSFALLRWAPQTNPTSTTGPALVTQQ